MSLMPKHQDYPVMIPYKDLCELLETTNRIKEYEAEVARMNRQMLALRVIQQQCLEKLRELEKLL